MNISFIGFGNMAKAIANGLLQHKGHRIYAASPSLPTEKNEDGINTFSDNLEAIKGADIIILAVKPQQIGEVSQQIQHELDPNCLVITLAAGIRLSWYEQAYGSNQAIVRAMPNVAAAVGESATPLIGNACLSEAQKQHADEIFKQIGRVVWLKEENEIDAFTALSGSGPAYVFLFMQALVDGAVRLGIEKQLAYQFAWQTIQGAASVVRDTDLNLEALIKQVASPGGTTEAALNSFQQHHFSEAVHEAMEACYNRAKTIGE